MKFEFGHDAQGCKFVSQRIAPASQAALSVEQFQRADAGVVEMVQLEAGA